MTSGQTSEDWHPIFDYATFTTQPVSNLPKPMSKVTEMWVDNDYTNLSCGGHTWEVDAFNRIQAAIYAAELNSTTSINILPGDYYERITIDRPVKLIGEETGSKQLVSNISGDYGEAWALICVSANDMGIGDIYPDRDCFPAQGLQAYYALKNIGYDDDHIILMLWHDDESTAPAYDCEPGDDDDGVDEYISIYDGTNNWLNGPDGLPGNSDDPVIDVENINVTKGTLQEQIANLSTMVTPDDQVLFYFVNHGRKYGTPQKSHIYFEDDTNGTAGQYLDADTLDLWLDQIYCKRMSILIDMCRAGAFINSSTNFTEEPNRVIIGASSDINNIAHAWFNANSLHFAGSWFFHPFWKRINAEYTIKRAYEYALEESDIMAEDHVPQYAYQYPFLIDKVRDADTYGFVPYGGNIINFLSIEDNGSEISNCLIKGDKNKTSIGINVNNRYVFLNQALVNDTNTTFHEVTTNCSTEDSSYFDFFPTNQSEFNDSFMISGSEKFSRIFIKLSPGGTGAGGSFVLECAIDRNTWIPVIVRADYTNNLSQTGDILFIPPIEWAYQSHNHTLTRDKSEYGYWVRLRLLDKFEKLPVGDYLDLSYYTDGPKNITSNRIISHGYGINIMGIKTDVATRGLITDMEINNNKILSNDKYGLYIYHSKGIPIIDNTINSNNWSAVHLNDSYLSTIDNNHCLNNDYGISILYSSSNSLDNNICNSNNRRGIYIRHSDNFTISNNTCRANSWSGIHLFNSFANYIIDNTCLKNGYGLSLSSSVGNTLTNNNCTLNTRRGIYISRSDNNIISDNNCNSNNWSAVRLWIANNNTLTNNHGDTNNITGIILDASTTNVIENCTFSSNPYHDFYLENNSENNVAINTTFDIVYFYDSTSELIVKNYLHIQVNDSNGTPSQGVDIKVEDNDITIYSTPGYNGSQDQTNSRGQLNWILVTDRIYDGASVAIENVTTVGVENNDIVFWNNNRTVDMSTSHVEYFYPNSLPDQMILESPANNSYLNLSAPVFNWLAGSDNNSDSLTYHVQIDYFGLNWNSIIASKYTEVNELFWFPIIPFPDGNYQWCVCANDGYGNSSWSDSWNFTIDTTPPSSNITHPVSDGFYNSLDTITGSAIDPNNGTGLTKVEITIKRLTDNNYWNGLAWDPGKFWLPVEGTTEWSYDSSAITWISGAQYSIRSIATDLVSNLEISSSSVVINIDQDSPRSTIDIPINDTWLSHLENISGSTKDLGGSGIELVEISILKVIDNTYWDSSDWDTNETWLSSTGLEEWFYNTSNVNWSTDIQYKIRVRGIDYVGNLEFPGAEISFWYDNKPPVISISINNGDLYTSSKTAVLSLTSEDSGSGTAQMAFSVDNSTWSVWDSFFSIKPFKLSNNDGEKSVYFRVNDNVGNIAEPVFDTIILDTTPPHSLSILINAGTIETNSTSVILALDAHDEHSGVFQMSFSVDGKTWMPWLDFANSTSYNVSSGDGEKTIYFKVKDSIGNVADPVFASIILNTTTPPVNDTTKDDKTTTDELSPFILYGIISIIIIIVILIAIICMIWIKKRKYKDQPGQDTAQIEDTEE